jgi:ubiquinone biosynthesis protein UbiJ
MRELLHAQIQYIVGYYQCTVTFSRTTVSRVTRVTQVTRFIHRSAVTVSLFGDSAVILQNDSLLGVVLP